jgi:hypothetical protein
MTAVKRCPRCGQLMSAEEFYRRRRGRRLSAYCQPCTQTASRETHRRRRQEPAAAAMLRAVDRTRQHRHRTLGRQGRDGR